MANLFGVLSFALTLDRLRSSWEYLRTALLMAAAPWQEHPTAFTHKGQPHVSDMFVMKHLVATNQV